MHVRNHTADVGGSNPSRHIKTDSGGGYRMCMLPRDNIRKTSYLKGYVQIEGDSSLLTLRTAKAVGFLLLPLLH